MSEQPPGPAPEPAQTPPAPPIWQNKWVLGGAAAAVLLVGWQMTQKPAPQPPPKGEVITVGPVGPNGEPLGGPNGQPPKPGDGGPYPGFGGPAPATGPNGQPVATGPTGQPVTGPNGQPVTGPNGQPVAQGPNGQPVQQPPQPPQGGLVETDPQPMSPLLAAPDQTLPWINVDYTPVIGSNLNFKVRTRAGVHDVSVILPDGWDNGWATITFALNGNGGSLYSIGRGTTELRSWEGRPQRVYVPQWMQDNASVGGICLAFVGRPGQNDVSLTDSALCVMNRDCTQPYACGKPRI